MFLYRALQGPQQSICSYKCFIVSITTLSASLGHFIKFAQAGSETLMLVFSIVIFTIPVVIIGGQIGPLVANRIPQKIQEKSLAVLFFLVAILMIANVVMN